MQTVLKQSQPTAFITKGKQRLKQFSNKSIVYLHNGDNFEIELFNPTTSKILVKIFIEKQNVSQGGIILRPGERVFIERFLDIDKKFKFSTYEVNGNNSQVKEAIKNNGLIEVKFYKESQISNNYYYNPYDFAYTYSNSGGLYGMMEIYH